MSEEKKEFQLPEKCGTKDIADLYVNLYGGTRKDAEKAVKQTISAIVSALSAGSKINFIGQFALEVVQRAGRKGRNPKTNEEIEIPPYKVVKFKAGSLLKEALK